MDTKRLINSQLKLTRFLMSTKEEIFEYYKANGAEKFEYKEELDYIRFFSKDPVLCELKKCVREKIESTKDEYYMLVLSFVLNGIKQGKEYCNGEPFGLYDLLLSEYCNVDLDRLKYYAKKYLDDYDRKLAASFLGQADLVLSCITAEDVDYIKQLRTIRIRKKVNGEFVEITTDEVKDIVINILTSLNIPTNPLVYEQACKKTYNQLIKERKG